eukprot:Nk52_evm2s224 gene=Nk52_evmTU2s224
MAGVGETVVSEAELRAFRAIVEWQEQQLIRNVSTTRAVSTRTKGIKATGEEGEEKEQEQQREIIIAEQGPPQSYYASLCASVAYYTPERITRLFGEAVYRSLSVLETLALDTASKERVEAYMLSYARGKNYDYVNTPEDFGKFTIDDLHDIAVAYTNPNEMVSLLQGAGLGLGGMWLMAADIPMLLSINCRMLAQLAWIFGIDVNKQPHIVLQFLAAGVEHVLDDQEAVAMMPEEFREKSEGLGQEKREEESQEVDQDNGERDGKESSDEKKEEGEEIAGSRLLGKEEIEAEKEVIRSLTQDVLGEVKQGIQNEIVKQVSFALGSHFARSKLLQCIPIVGMVIGAGANYYYTSTNAEVALRLLKKKYLIDKHSLEHLTELYEKQFIDEWEFINACDVPENYNNIANCCKASTMSAEDTNATLASSFMSRQEHADVDALDNIPDGGYSSNEDEEEHGEEQRRVVDVL